MNQIEKINEFRSRFNIEPLVFDFTQEVEVFNARLKLFIEDLNRCSDYSIKVILENNVSEGYSVCATIDVDFDRLIYDNPLLNISSMSCILGFLLDKTDFYYALYLLESLLNDYSYFCEVPGVYGEFYYFRRNNGRFPLLIEPIKQKLQKLFNDSPCLNINPIFEKCIKDLVDGATIEYYKVKFYPAGDRALDTVLVDEVVDKLSNNSKKLYLEALGYYLQQKYIDAGDKLRQSLEAWLKECFNITGSGLEGIVKGQLSKTLKEKIGKTSYQEPFIESFIVLVRRYMVIHDEFIKHPKAEETPFIEAELEFILYQTGAIIRFVDKMLPDNDADPKFVE
jgi:hypothetical protein